MADSVQDEDKAVDARNDEAATPSEPLTATTAPNNKKSLILAMLALVVIVGGIVGGAAYFLSSKASPASKSGTTTDTSGQSTPTSDAASPKAPGTPADSSTPGSAPTPPADSPTTPPPAKASSTATSIIIDGTSLNPNATTVKKGSTVTWTNKDVASHAIAETDTQSGPHSPQLKSGESYTYVFSAAGTYHYHDVINPSSTGTVTVTN